jgi:hypothetical protein
MMNDPTLNQRDSDDSDEDPDFAAAKAKGETIIDIDESDLEDLE